MSDDGKMRLAIVASHPIQYFVPFYRRLAAEHGMTLRIFFASRIGLDKTFDHLMGTEVRWATDLLGGYDSEFLAGADENVSTGFFDLNNRDVGKRLSAYGPAAVIIHGYASLTMLRALLWCRLKGVPAIMTSDSSNQGVATGLLRRLKARLLPLLLAQFGAFLTMSDRSDSHLTSLGVPADRLFRTPTMIDPVFWKAREERGARRAGIRAALNLPDDAFVLIYSGKLFARKRVRDIFDALGIMKSSAPREPTPVLLVAGDGEQRRELEMLAQERGLDVRFLGFVNIDLLPDYYCAADALVHPAAREPFGMIALEAAIIGLPLVLSDEVGAVGATSIARPDENTLLYRCGDVPALRVAIERLQADRGLRQGMANASLDISEDHRGAKSIAGALLAVSSAIRAR